MRVLATAVFLLAGVAEAAAPGFIPGEGMTFALSVGPIPAGKARMSVGAPASLKGRRLSAMHGEAHSADWLRFIARLDDDYKVVFDADRLEPLEVTTEETGVRERHIRSEVDGARVALDFKDPKESYHQSRVIAGVPRDPVTCLFHLRAAPLRPGETMVIQVLDGPALYRATVRVAGTETVTFDGPNVLGDGKMTADALKLEIEAARIADPGQLLKMPLRHITLWLSNDSRRIPLRVEGDTDLGRARVELTSWASPPGGK